MHKHYSQIAHLYQQERLSNSQIYLKASFNEILTPLRKQYGLDMDIDGNTIYLIPNGESFNDTSIIDLGELPLDATMKVDSARLYSSVKVGSTAESFDFTDEENGSRLLHSLKLIQMDLTQSI